MPPKIRKGRDCNISVAEGLITNKDKDKIIEKEAVNANKKEIHAGVLPCVRRVRYQIELIIPKPNNNPNSSFLKNEFTNIERETRKKATELA